MLKRGGINTTIGSQLREHHVRTYDEGLLVLVVQNPEVVKNVDYHYLLREFSEDYWRMGVLEGLLQSDAQQTQAIAVDYPIEFT